MEWTTLLTSKPEDRQYIMKDMSRVIQKEYLALQLQSTSDMEHLCKIAVEVRWTKLWDLALDHGIACISSLRKLVRIINHPKHAPSPCPICQY